MSAAYSKVNFVVTFVFNSGLEHGCFLNKKWIVFFEGAAGSQVYLEDFGSHIQLGFALLLLPTWWDWWMLTRSLQNPRMKSIHLLDCLDLHEGYETPSWDPSSPSNVLIARRAQHHPRLSYYQGAASSSWGILRPVHGPAATTGGINKQAKLDKDLQNSCILKAFISKYP